MMLKQFELLDGSGNKSGPTSRCSRWPAQGEVNRDPEQPLAHYGKALGQLEKRITPDKLKDRSKIERMLGTIQARHPSVNDLYKVAVREEQGGLRLQ